MTTGGDRFHHPYVPYDIQVQLMDQIYRTIDNGFKVGLFESPTGTGKTLSLICSTMTWLRNYKKNPTLKNSVLEDSDSDSDPEWVKESYEKLVLSKNKQELKNFELHLNEVSEEYDRKIARVHGLPSKKVKLVPEDDFVPEDYTSDTEVINDRREQLKNEVNHLLNKVHQSQSKIDNSILDDNSPRIFFSSRTHTQISQFTGQLAITSFESSLDDISERIKYIPLGSRKQFCVHPKVSKLSTTESVNDACSELTKKEHGCEFLCNSQSSSIRSQFNDYSLTKIHDIQELKDLGTSLKVCPYYSVRDSLKMTEIISLPYQLLLEPNSREGLKLDLKNSIIIIDEAHNLLDTINSMNSASISLTELSSLGKCLKLYLSKFVKRFNSGNRINLMKLIKICQILELFIKLNLQKNTIKSGTKIEATDMLGNSTGDLFNVHKLNDYLKKSKVAFKIENYLEKEMEGYKVSSNPLLFKFIKFLRSLSNPSKEGKFFWNLSTPSNPSIDYMLLDPSEIFKPIVDSCKCLILAGGTMEPMSDYKEYLFPYLSQDQINLFSCDHIIPPENLKAIPIASYNSEVFDFLFKNRNNKTLLRNLGNCIIDIMQSVPDGVIVFFPSYKYLNETVQEWESSSLLNNIKKHKSVFFEPTSGSEVNKVLGEYASNIKQGNGAILFSVVGGKLSEGINFLDELARSVIMVGLPYPNLMSGELIAKKNFIEESTFRKTGSRQLASDRSRSFIENICMRSINQSIGRSIRHINDYAMIYLIDQRYAKPNIQDKLSGWIRQRLIRNLTFNEVMQQSNEFFMTKSIKKLV